MRTILRSKKVYKSEVSAWVDISRHERVMTKDIVETKHTARHYVFVVK